MQDRDKNPPKDHFALTAFYPKEDVMPTVKDAPKTAQGRGRPKKITEAFERVILRDLACISSLPGRTYFNEEGIGRDLAVGEFCLAARVAEYRYATSRSTMNRLFKSFVDRGILRIAGTWGKEHTNIYAFTDIDKWAAWLDLGSEGTSNSNGG